MYHPAAALRQASLKETMERDMAAIPDALIRARAARDGAEPTPRPRTVVEPRRLRRSAASPLAIRRPFARRRPPMPPDGAPRVPTTSWASSDGRLP